jgi:formylglycine-generating enzyme required for sulfatase activity
MRRPVTGGVSILVTLALAGLTDAGAPVPEAEQVRRENEAMFRQLKQDRGLTDSQVDGIRRIVERSGYMSQGNPAVSRHPVTPEQCQATLKGQGVRYENPRFEKICGGKYLAPLYDPATQRPEDARVCIDQFEFPDVPCAYPVVWVKAREAAETCSAVGERLADAHEWEGACEGDLQPPDYRFDLALGLSPGVAVERMRAQHNRAFASTKRWSYGPQYENGVCATASQKTPGCNGGGWAACGSNTYPAGDFPACHSALDVYDLNGNAAEHMNLPLNEGQMSSRGSRELGYTEMKGSWFIFDSYRAHEDWCRWRAPYWHGSRVMDEHSHANYHLGFRCVKDIK